MSQPDLYGSCFSTQIREHLYLFDEHRIACFEDDVACNTVPGALGLITGAVCVLANIHHIAVVYPDAKGVFTRREQSAEIVYMWCSQATVCPCGLVVYKNCAAPVAAFQC